MGMSIIKTLKKYIKFIGKISLNKKIYMALPMIFILCSSMTACNISRPTTPDIVIEYQVPFAKSMSKWNEVTLVEQDAFGRNLYSFKSEGIYTNVFSDYMDESFTNAPVLIYLIVQKRDDNYVYCYENLCYIYVTSFDVDNTEIVEKLKELNDWGLPINDVSLTALPIDIKKNGILDYNIASVEKNIINLFEKKIGRKIESYYLDCIFSADAEPIYILREIEQWAFQTTDNKFGKSYIFVVLDDFSTVAYQELSADISNWNKEINFFRTEAIRT